MEGRSGEEHSGVSCAKCGAPLAHDQRYCVQCGNRRAERPQYVSALIASILERGRRIASPAQLPQQDPEPREDDDEGSSDPWVVTPRAAAAAVLGMLGFGVIVGALVGGAGASLLRPILVELHPVQSLPSSAVVASTPTSSPTTSASSTPTAQTITVTSPASSSPTTSGGGGGGSGGGKHKKHHHTTPGPLPPIKHVFLIVLSGQGYQATFGHSTSDPYLATTLVKQGFLIPFYYSVAQSPLANEVALVSGQGPTRATVDDCPLYTPLRPGKASTYGQFAGQGCTYPKAAQTLPEELTQAHMTWKAYVQVAKPTSGSKLETCVPKTGSKIKTDHIYGPWLNPFLYFQSMTTKSYTTKGCLKDAVSLDQLKSDLKKPQTTPTLSYIVPDLCDDGNPLPCAKKAPAGMTAADTFLKSVVPEIMNSKAYKTDGLIAITFDNAPQSGPTADSSECCDNPAYPNLPPPSGTGTTTTSAATVPTPVGTVTVPVAGSITSAITSAITSVATTTTTTTTTTTLTTTTTTTPTGTTTTGTGTTGTTTTPTTCTTTYGGTCPTGGGGQVGLLLLSKYVVVNTQEPFDYFNHFALLGSLDAIFGFSKLGYAADTSLTLFTATNVFKNYTP